MKTPSPKPRDSDVYQTIFRKTFSCCPSHVRPMRLFCMILSWWTSDTRVSDNQWTPPPQRELPSKLLLLVTTYPYWFSSCNKCPTLMHVVNNGGTVRHGVRAVLGGSIWNFLCFDTVFCKPKIALNNNNVYLKKKKSLRLQEDGVTPAAGKWL